jgi:sterol 3beta-glucosyltransferase
MDIAIIAYGTRGDVQPALALGRALQACGHHLKVIAGTNFKYLIEQHGMLAVPADIDFENVLNSESGYDLVELGNGRNFRTLVRSMKRLFAEFGPAMMEGVTSACADAELIISSFTSDVYAASIAEKLGLRHISATLQPALVATRDGTVTMNAPLPGRESLINYVFNRLLVEPFNWRVMSQITNRYREEKLSLPAMRWQTYRRRFRAMPIIQGFSAHVVPQPRDWPPTIHTTGYWFLDDDQAAQSPPGGLTDFLAAGEPPVFIGFGSITGRDPLDFTRVIVEAVARTRQRAVIQSGWAGLGDMNMPGNMYLLTEPVSHKWLFPQVSTVVHHGGAGTTAEGLRAGIPTVTVPHNGDQPFWAARIPALGVGPRPIPRAKLTPDRLAAALASAASDRAMRRNAAVLGARISAENGASRAAELIDQYISSHG